MVMDELTKKVEELLKSLLSVKTNASKDLMVPALKPPSIKVPKPSLKQPTLGKIPSGLPPPSKKDPVKMAEQLKNPQPGKAKVEILKVESNGQWSLAKSVKTPGTPVIGEHKAVALENSKAPIHTSEGFANHHGPEQNKLIHGLNIYDTPKLDGGWAGGGSYKANNPVTGGHAIVKKASAHADQAERGHLNNGFNSAKREVLFHNMAKDYFGMGKHVPTTSGFNRGGEDYSAQEFKENADHPDLKEKPPSTDETSFGSDGPDEFKHPQHAKTLKKLHESGDLHKLALMDNIMGHHDRHSHNMMMDTDKDNLHLIDNGTAFDYKNFDSLHPYPAYMRHAENPNIKGMGLDNTQLHPEAVKWLNKLDPQKAKEMLAAHGHDEHSPATQGMLRRLQGMKNAVNNGPEHYGSVKDLLDKNRATSGPIPPPVKKHVTAEPPQW